MGFVRPLPAASPGLAWSATFALGESRPDTVTNHPHHRIGLLAPQSHSAVDSGFAHLPVQALLPDADSPLKSRRSSACCPTCNIDPRACSPPACLLSLRTHISYPSTFQHALETASALLSLSFCSYTTYTCTWFKNWRSFC